MWTTQSLSQQSDTQRGVVTDVWSNSLGDVVRGRVREGSRGLSRDESPSTEGSPIGLCPSQKVLLIIRVRKDRDKLGVDDVLEGSIQGRDPSCFRIARK